MGERPALRPWSRTVQVWFARLPATTEKATSAQEACAAMVAVLEQMQAVLLPTPSIDLDVLLTAYLGELLALYRECPSEPSRAIRLHDRANEAGRRFENTVNRSLRELTSAPAMRPAPR
jgi:hypothetical protein